jgi:hypothetical protein
MLSLWLTQEGSVCTNALHIFTGFYSYHPLSGTLYNARHVDVEAQVELDF